MILSRMDDFWVDLDLIVIRSRSSKIEQSFEPFNRILQSQLDEARKEKEHQEERHTANLRHAADIRKQIVSREQKRIRDRQNYFEEAEKKIAEEIGKLRAT